MQHPVQFVYLIGVVFGDIFAGMHTDVFMMFDCLQRCIKERTPLPYINVGAMTRVNPPLAFIFFNIFSSLVNIVIALK